ncbi:ferredoxin [Jatrophihabitans sp.]|uniref:ferredoxin n=1 Tax=Jatrophihabitans sp. TaxID=1932789 RepID=UPI0030C6893D|nr:ferredoxin [Jatrophihabitans sp.]
MTYVIGLNCVDTKDRTCIEHCPVDCIYEGDRMLYIHPEECIDCGACEPVCPVDAIVYESDATDGDLVFAEAARTLFEALGSPGGSAKTGLVPDPDVIAELPPKPARASN